MPCWGYMYMCDVTRYAGSICEHSSHSCGFCTLQSCASTTASGAASAAVIKLPMLCWLTCPSKTLTGCGACFAPAERLQGAMLLKLHIHCLLEASPKHWIILMVECWVPSSSHRWQFWQRRSTHSTVGNHSLFLCVWELHRSSQDLWHETMGVSS